MAAITSLRPLVTKKGLVVHRAADGGARDWVSNHDFVILRLCNLGPGNQPLLASVFSICKRPAGRIAGTLKGLLEKS